jgi:hypothetical protein
MFRGRSAIVMLVGAMLLTPTASRARCREHRSNTTLAFTSEPSGAIVAGGFFGSRSSPPARISRHVVWRARPKIVLEQRDRQAGEECDLGLAPVLTGLSGSAPISLQSSRPSSPHHLRC